MARYTRNSAVLAKIETTYGTDAAPAGASDALLVSNLSITPLNAQNQDRSLMRGYLGGSDQLVGNSYKDVSFSTEIAGSGAAGTAPAWGKLLRACGFAEAITAGNRVEYTPISQSFESLTGYYYADGAVHKLLGCRGTAQFDLTEGARPLMKSKFMGLDGGISSASTPGLTLTAWQKPLVITDPNTGDVTLGCTYSAGALSGGTVYPSRGLTLDLGVSAQYIPTLGGQSIDITQRVVVGAVTLDLTPTQEVSLMANVQSNITTSLGMVHGTTAGNKVLIYAPAVQLINPKLTDFNGRILCTYDLRFLPVSGNDELRIVAL